MLHIFIRHCFYSSASSSKQRPLDFNRKTIFQNVLKTIGQEDYHIVLDETHRPTISTKHFTEEMVPSKVTCIEAGTEPIAFIAQLQLVQHLFEQWNENDIVVFLEDDYAVTDHWVQAIQEGLQFADYVTLYDHPDKYKKEIYPQAPSELFVSSLCHWRTTPSTTNSFACKYKTLKQDLQEHVKWSAISEVPFTMDHQKFLSLWSKGRSLVSSIPAFWSHEEEGMQPPFYHK